MCAQCHAQEVKHFDAAAMASALESIANCSILKKHPKLKFQEGLFSSEIVRDGDRSILTVVNGKEQFTAPLLWAFGRGRAGQTYVFEHNGALYESRVSYFEAIDALDVTMGAAGSQPADIEQAAGRKMDDKGARDCFACHSTGAVREKKLSLDTMSPGVGCESCHGPVSGHVAAIRAGDAEGAKMKKLSAASAMELADLCGGCHRTWSQIAQNGPTGINNVRFQPYRLTNSKCYDPDDSRIRFTACHDPHAGPVREAAYYDSKCAACHAAALHTKTCPVAKTKCVTCHMPKIDLPGAHMKFSDHQIRIARANDPYPN
jgi:hypothetical protein